MRVSGHGTHARISDRFIEDAARLGLAQATDPRVTVWQANGAPAISLLGVSRLAARIASVLARDVDDVSMRRYAIEPARNGAPRLAVDVWTDVDPPVSPELVDFSLVLIAQRLGMPDPTGGHDGVAGTVVQLVPAPGHDANPGLRALILRTDWGAIDVVWAPGATLPLEWQGDVGDALEASGHLTARVFEHDPTVTPADGKPLAPSEQSRVGHALKRQ